MAGVMFDQDTDYVYTAIVNYEPTYIALRDIAARWMDDQTSGIAEYREELRASVEQLSGEHMGLTPADLTDDVDYAAIIQFEADEE